MLCYSFISHQGFIVALLLSYLLAFHRGRGFPSPAPYSTSSSGTQRQPVAFAASCLQRPKPGRLSPSLQNKLQIKRKVTETTSH